MKSIDDELFEINLSSVKLNRTQITDETLDSQSINVMAVDSVTNEFFFAKKGTLTVYSKKIESNQWILKHRVKIYDEKSKSKNKALDASNYGEALEIGIIESQKAILFYEGGGAFTYNQQNQKIGKYLNFT